MIKACCKYVSFIGFLFLIGRNLPSLSALLPPPQPAGHSFHAVSPPAGATDICRRGRTALAFFSLYVGRAQGPPLRDRGTTKRLFLSVGATDICRRGRIALAFFSLYVGRAQGPPLRVRETTKRLFLSVGGRRTFAAAGQNSFSVFFALCRAGARPAPTGQRDNKTSFSIRRGDPCGRPSDSQNPPTAVVPKAGLRNRRFRSLVAARSIPRIRRRQSTFGVRITKQRPARTERAADLFFMPIEFPLP